MGQPVCICLIIYFMHMNSFLQAKYDGLPEERRRRRGWGLEGGRGGGVGGLEGGGHHQRPPAGGGGPQEQDPADGEDHAVLIDRWISKYID